MSKRTIGLDIGTWALKAAYQDTKDPTRLGTSERVEWPRAVDDNATPNVAPAPGAPEEGAETPMDDSAAPGTPMAEALSKLCARITSGDDAVLANSQGTEAVTLHLDVPFAERAKAASVLPHLLMDKLPVGIHEVVWDFQLQARGEQNEALVGFMRRAVMGARLVELQEAGFDPRGILPAEHALAIAFRALHAGESAAVLDIGHTYSRLVVVAGDRLVLARTIMNAGKQITGAIAKTFRVDMEEAEKVKHQYAALVSPAETPNEQMKLLGEAIRGPLKNLVRDVRRSLQAIYARERVEVPALYITGGTSTIKGMDRFLEAELGLPVKRLRVPADFSAISLGLLTAHDDKIAPRQLNLRQGEFAYRGKSEFVRKQFAIFAVAMLAVLLALGAVLMIQKSSHEARRDAMRETLQQRSQAILGQKLTKKKDIERVVGGDDSQVASFVPKMSAYELMHLVTSKISSDIELKLTRFEVDIDRKVIQIMGETTDAQAVDKIVSDLETIECLKSIKKDKLKVKTDGKADFELQIATECS